MSVPMIVKPRFKRVQRRCCHYIIGQGVPYIDYTLRKYTGSHFSRERRLKIFKLLPLVGKFDMVKNLLGSMLSIWSANNLIQQFKTSGMSLIK